MNIKAKNKKNNNNMKKEELIGKKVRGFRFVSNRNFGLQYMPNIMDNYIDKVGEMVDYNIKLDSYRVKFEDGMSYHYPAERIEHHLVVEEPTKEINYNHISVRICEDNSLIGYYTDDCGITSFGKTFDELLRNLQHAKKAIEEARERLAKEDLEEAKIKANKGVDISIDCKSSNDLKSESLNESCIDYGKIEHNPLDDLPIIGGGVLMEVSDDKKEWHERNVVGKLKNDSFLAVSDYGPAVILWNFARPIPKTKITRKEFESKFEIID
jgi:predicted RNase H-like HicB family nuclease